MNSCVKMRIWTFETTRWDKNTSSFQLLLTADLDSWTNLDSWSADFVNQDSKCSWEDALVHVQLALQWFRMKKFLLFRHALNVLRDVPHVLRIFNALHVMLGQVTYQQQTTILLFVKKSTVWTKQMYIGMVLHVPLVLKIATNAMDWANVLDANLIFPFWW